MNGRRDADIDGDALGTPDHDDRRFQHDADADRDQDRHIERLADHATHQRRVNESTHDDREHCGAEDGEPKRAVRHQAAAVKHVTADDRQLAMREVHHSPGLVKNGNAGGEQRICTGQDDDGGDEFHRPGLSLKRAEDDALRPRRFNV